MSGLLLNDEMVCKNSALMMYEPLLQVQNDKQVGAE